MTVIIRMCKGPLTLSACGILVVVLLVGTAFIPRQLRADGARRIAGLARYVDTTLAHAWLSAFPSSGSNDLARVFAKPKDGGLHPDSPLAFAGFALPFLTAASPSLIDINGFGPSSYNAEYGTVSSTNSMATLLKDILKNDSVGAGGGFEAWASNPAGSGGAFDLSFGGARVSSGGAALVGLLHSTSSSDGALSSTLGLDGNAEGMFDLTDANPDAHNLYSSAHQGPVAGLGNDRVSAYDAANASGKPVASSGSPSGRLSDEPAVNLGGFVSDAVGASRSQVASNESPNGLFGNEAGASHSNNRPHVVGGADTTLDPTTADLVQQLLGRSEYRLQGDGFGRPVFQNEIKSGADSVDWDEQVLDFADTRGNGPLLKNQGLRDGPITLAADSGRVSSVAEPRSLALLSVGLGAIILWRKFRSAD